MSASDIDDYLAGLDDTPRATLSALRRTILTFVPDADQGLSYGVPAFRLDGAVIAGFSAARSHLSYLPHSGEVLSGFAPDELAPFTASTGALRMPLDQALPPELVARLIAARRAEAGV